jgi:hypothetical protein
VINERPLPKGTSPEAFANEVLRRWDSAEPNLTAMVFTIAEPLSAIHIAISGRGLSKENTRRLREVGNQALAAMPSQAPFADAAATAATELQRQLIEAEISSKPLVAVEDSAPVLAETEHSSLLQEPASPAPSSRWEALSRKLNWQMIRVVSSVLGGLLVSICALLLLRRHYSRRGLVFPAHLPRKRFSAPFAGGSNAQIGYRPQ